MADVTISELSPITPATSLFLPASNGTTTGNVTLSQVCGVMTSTQITAALGYTPVQQGGGAGQLTNKLYMGWSSSGLLLQIDVTNFANTWPISVSGNAATASNGAKAWVSFNGDAGSVVSGEFRCTIRSSYNVNRVVRNSTGEYTVYFGTSFADANYCATATGGGGDTNANNSALDCWSTQFNAAYVRVGVADNGTSNNTNAPYINVTVFK
jgi:hypothetical protein